MVSKENILPMIRNKNVILLTASVTTGLAPNEGTEFALYYGEVLRGITVIFSALDEINGYKITSILNERDVPEYASYDYKDCPFCRQGGRLEMLVNSYEYTNL